MGSDIHGKGHEELILIILIIAVCLCAGAALFVWRREKRTAERIQEMLDNASAGKLPGSGWMRAGSLPLRTVCGVISRAGRLCWRG